MDQFFAEIKVAENSEADEKNLHYMYKESIFVFG